jgi:uncharacterized damage-inducible protein DinB
VLTAIQEERSGFVKILTLLTLGLTLGLAEPANAQSGPNMPTSLRAGLVARFDEASSKIAQLAEAIPGEKYAWRPSPGVRSISEALVHVAQGNYYTTGAAGVKAPFKMREDEENTITAKPQVIEFLKRSTEHMRNELTNLTNATLQRPATMFKQQTTVGNVYLFGVSHLHEHLGQLISYARVNGVAPPWSAGQ